MFFSDILLKPITDIHFTKDETDLLNRVYKYNIRDVIRNRRYRISLKIIIQQKRY